MVHKQQQNLLKSIFDPDNWNKDLSNKTSCIMAAGSQGDSEELKRKLFDDENKQQTVEAYANLWSPSCNCTPSSSQQPIDNQHKSPFAQRSLKQNHRQQQVKKMMSPQRRRLGQRGQESPGRRILQEVIRDHNEDDDDLTIEIGVDTFNTVDKVVDEEPLEKDNNLVNKKNLNESLTHCWSQPGGHYFQIRGKRYLEDGLKYDSSDQIFPTRGVDLFLTNGFGPSNIGRHNGILGGNLRDKATFIINFRFPWGVLVFYYEIPTKYLVILKQKHEHDNCDDDNTFEEFARENNSPHDKAIYKFIMGDDQYRNSKLKFIPKIIQGNPVVRKLVKGKPVIIGKKLPVSYIYEPPKERSDRKQAEYWEVDLDIGSSSLTAKKIVSICKKYMKSISLDMGFVIEGCCEEELPERMLACTRIHHFDANLCQVLQ